jgi:hypothetical protein
MHNSDARKLLLLSGFVQDDTIICNEREYYIRDTHPIITFSIPKEGNLSSAKEHKLLEIVNRIMESNPTV